MKGVKYKGAAEVALALFRARQNEHRKSANEPTLPRAATRHTLFLDARNGRILRTVKNLDILRSQRHLRDVPEILL